MLNTGAGQTLSFYGLVNSYCSATNAVLHYNDMNFTTCRRIYFFPRTSNFPASDTLPVTGSDFNEDDLNRTVVYLAKTAIKKAKEEAEQELKDNKGSRNPIGSCTG